MTATEPPHYLARPDGTRLAFRRRLGVGGAGVVFLGGFRSDMTGTKASALDLWAAGAGRNFVRFDYFGHGESSGDFRDGTIGRWRDDALAVLDELTEGPQVLVGSSLGGWIALLAARDRPERVRALVLVAPAPDFTEDLMWARYPDEVKRQLQEVGWHEEPSAYHDEPDLVTMKLIEEGRKHLLLRGPIPLACPMRLLHGMKDEEVPWETSLRIAQAVTSGDVIVTLVKSGDHRLSEPADLDRLIQALAEMCHAAERAGRNSAPSSAVPPSSPGGSA